MTTLTIKLGRKTVTVERPRIVGQPLMVSCGVGTDSIALLGLLYEQGVRPDVILFADTGSEKANTYAFIAVLRMWLRAVGFPDLTIVKNNSKRYSSLHENCLVNSTLPSLAFGMKGCSQKWKVEVMDTWTNSWLPAQLAWASGMKCLKLIGYDASPADCRRSKIASDEKYDYAYPLRDTGVRRDVCKEVIKEKMGLPDPGKSACFMCPAMKPAEVVALGESQPELLAIALKMEMKAEAFGGSEKRGVGFLSTKGLGRNWNWNDYIEQAHPALRARLLAEHDCGQEYREAALANRASQLERIAAYKIAKAAKLAQAV